MQKSYKRRFPVAMGIILAFAMVHAVACYFLRGTEFGDGWVLTCLTIGMVYVLIRVFNGPFDVFLGIAFLACFAGFYLGTQGAVWLNQLNPDLGIWAHVVTTFVVTFLLGCAITLVMRKKAT